MQEFLIILKVGLFFYAAVTYCSYLSKKSLLKEQRAKLLSNRRDTDLSQEERSAISELFEFEATSSEVYCIDEQFEVHAAPSEDNQGQEKYFLAVADYVIMMGDKAVDYLDEGRICAEVVLYHDILIVIGLNGYHIVDEVNNTHAEAPNQELSEEHSQHLADSDQAVLGQQSTSESQHKFDEGSLTNGEIRPETSTQTTENHAPIEHAQTSDLVPTVLKSERPVTLTEAHYLHLSSPFYNMLVPTLLVVAIGIFLHVSNLGLSLEPKWLSAVILATVCSATLLLLKRERPKPDPATLVVKQYFGKIKAIETRANKTWIVFITPDGEASVAWIPNEWEHTVNLDCDVQFEIEQSQSAVMRIGLNAVSYQETVKKKPQYIAAAMGLLFGVFFMAGNTHFDWREASVAIVNNHSSYQINRAADWPTSRLKIGDHLSITQPRLCLDSRDKHNRLVYCKEFEYPLASEGFKVTPNAASIEAYIHFITKAPDFWPDMPEEIYNSMVSIAKIKLELGFGRIHGYDRVRRQSEMMMFTTESLQKIAKHIALYCPIDAQSTESNTAKNPSVNRPQLTTTCTDFKQQFGILWNEATSSSCDASLCWDEALQGIVLDDDTAIINSDSAYLSSLRRLKNEIWQTTKASLTPPSPEQASITLNWSGEKNEDMRKIVKLRSKLDHINEKMRIKRLKELLLLQTAAAQQNIEGTILNVSNNGGHLTLTVVEKISKKQALNTIINLALIAFFGLLVALLFVAYLLSGQPRKDKQAKSEGAWIR
ncbi:hypothetical protein [Vibrio ostreicida]|uniref:hypothetical protein n=1 Tax=Vibrio ostreicida TaxID=526588 RepID=UPI00097132B4|nr:hypothetical protein [Vibrio ostreicida]